MAGVLLAELTAWLELSAVATAPTPTARYARSASAAFAKVSATASLVLTLDVCLAQAAAAQAVENTPLAVLYTALAGLATGVWTVSVLRYLAVQTQAGVIAIWGS